jgi:hypothetical protein
MNDRQNRIHQMSIRVRELMQDRSGDFSPTGIVRQLKEQLAAGITELEAHSAAQGAGVVGARQGTRTVGDARLALRRSLEAINRAARTMNLEDKFPPPPQANDRNLIQAGRTAALNALPLKADFITHEMPDNFITELTADVVDFEEAIADRDGAVDDHVNSSAAIDDTVDQIMEVVRKLDGPMKNKYADNPAALAEWLAASHIERAPRRHQQPPPTPTTPTAPAG